MRENLSEKFNNDIEGTQLDIQVMKLVAEVTWFEIKAQLEKLKPEWDMEVVGRVASVDKLKPLRSNGFMSCFIIGLRPLLSTVTGQSKRRQPTFCTASLSVRYSRIITRTT
jgi:hypothetical protein